LNLDRGSDIGEFGGRFESVYSHGSDSSERKRGFLRSSLHAGTEGCGLFLCIRETAPGSPSVRCDRNDESSGYISHGSPS
jgi:hypothetical protein